MPDAEVLDNIVDMADVRKALCGSSAPKDVRQIPPMLLAKLRSLRGMQQGLIEGCIEGMGISLSGQNVDFNIDTGTITVLPIT